MKIVVFFVSSDFRVGKNPAVGAICVQEMPVATVELKMRWPRLRHRLTTEIIKESLPGVLKILTVYLIIWAGAELALVGAFNRGASLILY